MPIKMPNAPDFTCHKCGHFFRESIWQRLIKIRKLPFPIPRKCPKCGSRDVGVLMY